MEGFTLSKFTQPTYSLPCSYETSQADSKSERMPQPSFAPLLWEQAKTPTIVINPWNSVMGYPWSHSLVSSDSMFIAGWPGHALQQAALTDLSQQNRLRLSLQINEHTHLIANDAVLPDVIRRSSRQSSYHVATPRQASGSADCRNCYNLSPMTRSYPSPPARHARVPRLNHAFTRVQCNMSASIDTGSTLSASHKVKEVHVGATLILGSLSCFAWQKPIDRKIVPVILNCRKVFDSGDIFTTRHFSITEQHRRDSVTDTAGESTSTFIMLTWLAGSDTKPPLFLKYRSSTTFIISTVALAIFTDIFVYSVIVPVLPFALTVRAGVDPNSIQTWVSVLLAIYGAAILAASPICGWAADRTSSRRLPMIAGLLALGGSTVMLCVGDSIALFAGGRFLGGVSAAVVWTVGLALLVDTVGGDNIGQAMGVVGTSLSVALLLGPLLGGVVFSAAGYYSTYAIGFGLITLDIFMRISMIEKKAAKRWMTTEESQDNVTAASDGAGVSKEDQACAPSPSSCVDVEENGQQDTEPEVDMASLRDRDKRTSSSTEANLPAPKSSLLRRLPPVITLLASRRILSTLWGCMIQGALMTAFDSILPLFVRNTFHWNSLGAGLIFLPIAIIAFLSPLVGQISDKYGSRWLATAGFVLTCPCLILLRTVHENTLNQKVLLCALLALNGLGLTLSVTPLMAEICYAVDAKARRRPPGYFGKYGVYAQAYSLFNAAWALGCTVGPLLAGLINQKAGWNVTTLVLGCVSIATAVPTAIWTGGSIWKVARRQHEEEKEDE
nr:putative mfs-type transporter c18.02 [Quercus suber]